MRLGELWSVTDIIAALAASAKALALSPFPSFWVLHNVSVSLDLSEN
ncbi:MAG: hypothetical protein ACKPE3_34145 [Sphaerospermopsis kisseleviana]